MYGGLDSVTSEMLKGEFNINFNINLLATVLALIYFFRECDHSCINNMHNI